MAVNLMDNNLIYNQMDEKIFHGHTMDSVDYQNNFASEETPYIETSNFENNLIEDTQNMMFHGHTMDTVDYQNNFASEEAVHIETSNFDQNLIHDTQNMVKKLIYENALLKKELETLRSVESCDRNEALEELVKGYDEKNVEAENRRVIKERGESLSSSLDPGNQPDLHQEYKVIDSGDAPSYEENEIIIAELARKYDSLADDYALLAVTLQLQNQSLNELLRGKSEKLRDKKREVRDLVKKCEELQGLKTRQAPNFESGQATAKKPISHLPEMPGIVIFDVPSNIASGKKELTSVIWEQNFKTTPRSEFLKNFFITHVFENEKSPGTLIVKAVCSTEMRWHLVRTYIYLDYQECKVKGDNAPINRCNICQQYGHTRITCTFPPVCSLCTGSHSHTICPVFHDPSKFQCAHCIRAKLDSTNHAATDRKCPIYKKVHTKNLKL